MKNTYRFIVILVTLIAALSGCKAKTDEFKEPYTAPRLIVNGTVRDEDGEGLKGIYVAIYGVREEQEKDIITYNYAITDTAGEYTIIRYRGRELPMEVTIVATDSTKVYQEQMIIAPVMYDSLYITKQKEPYNGYVTADFVLTKANSH
jgi:hypothetical protein